MEILMTIIRIAAIVVTTLTSMYFAYCAASVLSLALPAMYKFAGRKPFNCRPCLSFWLTWLFVSITALAVGSFALFVAGFMLSLVVFSMVKFSDSRKVTE